MKVFSQLLLVTISVHLMTQQCSCSEMETNQIQNSVAKRSTSACSTYPKTKIPRNCFSEWWKLYDDWHGGHDCRHLLREHPEEFQASLSKCRKVSMICNIGDQSDNLNCCKNIYCKAFVASIILPDN